MGAGSSGERNWLVWGQDSMEFAYLGFPESYSDYIIYFPIETAELEGVYSFINFKQGIAEHS